MPVTAVLVTTHRDLSARKKKLTVQATLSGAYVNGTPIVIDLTKVTNPKMISSGRPASNPKRSEVVNTPGGYSAKLTAGATMATWGLTIYSAPGTELASGALPAALTATPFEFEFEGPKGNF